MRYVAYFGAVLNEKFYLWIGPFVDIFLQGIHVHIELRTTFKFPYILKHNYHLKDNLAIIISSRSDKSVIIKLVVCSSNH